MRVIIFGGLVMDIILKYGGTIGFQRKIQVIFNLARVSELIDKEVG